jgi:nucleotide-binding universal stress UspA family protein
MKILIPTDGSPTSLDAVRYALKLLGNGLRASVVLANVQESATLYELVVVHDAKVIESASEAAGLHLLLPAQALLAGAGVRFESVVGSGGVANALGDIAERFACDLIVMSTRGHGAIANALLGSVSSAVVDVSRVPVTLVKGLHPTA